MSGAKAFGRTVAVILSVVFVIIMLTFVSFTLNFTATKTVSYNTTEIEYCNPPKNVKNG